MENDLIEYLTVDEKIKMAQRLLRSAIIYNHVKSMMQRGNKKSFSNSQNDENMQVRKRFDAERDYAFVLKESDPHPDRIRNYKRICAHEKEQMDILLQNAEVRKLVVENILNEEGIDAKKYATIYSEKVRHTLNPSFSKRMVKKLGTLMMNCFKTKEM